MIRMVHAMELQLITLAYMYVCTYIIMIHEFAGRSGNRAFNLFCSSVVLRRSICNLICFSMGYYDAQSGDGDRTAFRKAEKRYKLYKHSSTSARSAKHRLASSASASSSSSIFSSPFNLFYFVLCMFQKFITPLSLQMFSFLLFCLPLYWLKGKTTLKYLSPSFPLLSLVNPRERRKELSWPCNFSNTTDN